MVLLLLLLCVLCAAGLLQRGWTSASGGHPAPRGQQPSAAGSSRQQLSVTFSSFITSHVTVVTEHSAIHCWWHRTLLPVRHVLLDLDTMQLEYT